MILFPRAGGDPYEHVASVLVNISKKEVGRKLLLDPKRGLLKQIIRQFDSTNPLRKKGVSLRIFLHTFMLSFALIQMQSVLVSLASSQPKLSSKFCNFYCFGKQ